MSGGGRDEGRKQVRKAETEGESEGETERDGFKTKVMACCDKHWLKSLSRSDTTGTVQCMSLLTLNPFWSPRQIQNYKLPFFTVSLNENFKMMNFPGPTRDVRHPEHNYTYTVLYSIILILLSSSALTLLSPFIVLGVSDTDNTSKLVFLLL